MGRVLKILFYALLIIGAYFLVSWSFNACSSKSQELLEESGETLDAAAESLEDTGDELVAVFEDGAPDSESEGYIDEESAEDAEELFEETDYIDDGYEEPTTSNTTAIATPSSNSNARSYSSSSSGKYMVVAGNYLVQDNALNMVKRLNRMGYNDAEYVVFDQSNFYTVVASRSDSRSSAQSASNNLKSNGIDCYVHTKQY